MLDEEFRHAEELLKQGRRKEAFRVLVQLGSRPDANAAVHLHCGYMLDSMSRERRAIDHYVKALDLGLEPSDRVNCMICLASSYRNVKRFEDAFATIEAAASEFAGNEAVVLFQALILADLGRADEGLALAGSLAAKRIVSEPLEPYREVLVSRYKRLKSQSKKMKAQTSAKSRAVD